MICINNPVDKLQLAISRGTGSKALTFMFSLVLLSISAYFKMK